MTKWTSYLWTLQSEQHGRHATNLLVDDKGMTVCVQVVVNSGISCVVLRVGRTEGVDEMLGSESAVVVGAQQSLPPQSVITKSQARLGPPRP